MLAPDRKSKSRTRSRAFLFETPERVTRITPSAREASTIASAKGNTGGVSTMTWSYSLLHASMSRCIWAEARISVGCTGGGPPGNTLKFGKSEIGWDLGYALCLL